MDITGTLNTGASTDGTVACFFFLLFEGHFCGDTERRSNNKETGLIDIFGDSDLWEGVKLGEGLLEGGALKADGRAKFVEGRACTAGPC